MTNKDCDDLLSWIVSAKPREFYTYYIGHSLTDSILSLEIKKVSWIAACEGKIYLFRQRIIEPTGKTSLFRYMAQKASAPPKAWLVPLETADNRRDKTHHYRKWTAEIGAYNG